MPPSVEGRLQMLVADRVEVAELDVVLAGPLHPDRYARVLPGEKGRLDGKVRLGLAPEAAAQQRHVDLDLLPDLLLERISELDQSRPIRLQHSSERFVELALRLVLAVLQFW